MCKNMTRVVLSDGFVILTAKVSRPVIFSSVLLSSTIKLTGTKQNFLFLGWF